MSGFQDKANFIWSVADEILRDDFKRSRYADVILPFTVLRRIDCTLAPTKDRVLQKHEELKSRGLERVDDSLRRASGYFYFNISNYWVCPVSADCFPLSHSASFQSNLFVL